MMFLGYIIGLHDYLSLSLAVDSFACEKVYAHLGEEKKTPGSA